MAAIAALAIMQLVYGPKGSRVLLTLDPVSQRMFAVLLILGSLSCLTSIWLREPTGAYWERGGLTGVWIGLWVYTWTLADTIPWWQTTLGLGFFGVGAGCAARALQVHLDIRRYKRARQHEAGL